MSLSQAQSNIFSGKCTQILTLFTFSYSPALPENKYQQQAAMTIHTSFFSIWITMSNASLLAPLVEKLEPFSS